MQLHPALENPFQFREAILTQSLFRTLIDEFNRGGISYCHWKSNIDLSKTIGGELDIDLLISIRSLSRATHILMQLGFKAATPRWGTNPSGVFHYYGYDPDLEDLVHLHLFTQVLTGESFLKSHLFPFEEMMLKNTDQTEGVRIASKEAELVLFVLRMYIKYGSLLDSIRLLKSEKKVREEAEWLNAGSDRQAAIALLEEYCPVIDEKTFMECLNALLYKASFAQKWILSLKIRRRLRIYRKYSFLNSLGGHFQLLAGMLQKKIRKQKGSKILLTGGAIISIVGADATGKSTLVSETSRWLRKNFVLMTIHSGKPPSTLLTIPVNMLLGLYRRLKGRSNSFRNRVKPSDSNSEAEEMKGFNSLIYALRAVSLAWDRRALLLRARRVVANGEIIVSDRYPTRIIGMMDSPRLKKNTSRRGFVPSIYNWLARVEQTLYRQIPPPDIVLRLSVSLETAKKRNAAREIVDDEIYLQHRHQQATEWSTTGVRSIQDIATDPPLAETIQAVRQAIWRSL